jgi:hypothetical protein
MTQQEIDQFLYRGRGSMTGVATSAEALKIWADTFEERGGAPVLGDAALEIVYFNNELQEWLTPERRALISKYRTDV